jgi:FlaA1/EpsC-like NDP-sugar epimerase
MTARHGTPTTENLDELATGRRLSCFAADRDMHGDTIGACLDGARVLVIGAAGTIGEAIVAHPGLEAAALVCLLDISENGLVEVMRNFRARSAGSRVDVRSFCFDFGGTPTRSFLEANGPFDVVFNLAAVKHVRAERDVFSAIHMVETNVLKQRTFLGALAEFSPGARYFSVSTDKAANPSSLMGASKRIMEAVIFESDHGHQGPVTAARFANVAFSAGSLPEAWHFRLAKRQPIAAPRGVRRYFISRREAADLCLIATALAPSGHIAVPGRKLGLPEVDLSDLARRYLKTHGWTPVDFDDEARAIAALERLAAEGKWPLLLTPLDTSGEKELEEFVGADDVTLQTPFDLIDILRPGPLGRDRLDAFLDEFSRARSSNLVGKEDLSRMIRRLVPTLDHLETGISLDGRL